MLTGSVPLSPAAKVFETLAEHLGTHAPRYPDGEQVGWVRPMFEGLANNPVLEVSQQMTVNSRGPATPFYRLKAGKKAKDLKLGPYGYAKNAIASYQDFKRLKDEGRIPSGTRFQVTVPSPGMAVFRLQILGQESMPMACQAIWPDIEEILDGIPAKELTLHLDIAHDAHHEEYIRRPWAFTNMPSLDVFQVTLDQTADSVAWIFNQTPSDVEIGLHICSIWHLDMSGGQDNAAMADIANAVAAKITHPLAYVHLPIIPEHDKVSDYTPLRNLKLHHETKLYLGLINLSDGFEGAKRRVQLAEQAGIFDFGVAFYCGLGSNNAQVLADIPPQLHKATAETIGDMLDLHVKVAEL